jgi:hypothetical protein
MDRESHASLCTELSATIGMALSTQVPLVAGESVHVAVHSARSHSTPSDRIDDLLVENRPFERSLRIHF